MDADELLGRMREDDESDWPRRMLRRIENARPVTEPELLALKCASRGLTVAETGATLWKSPETIKRQLSSASRKLRAKNTTQACCEAIRQGLIP